MVKLVDRSDARQRSLLTIGRHWLHRLLKLDKPFWSLSDLILSCIWLKLV
jgi:hypothetical protein